MTKLSFEAKLEKLSRNAFTPEADMVKLLREECRFFNNIYPEILAESKAIIKKARLVKPRLFETFLHEFRLDSNEGRAVMALAEGLLRIPDKITQDKLIESTLESAEWNGNSKKALLTTLSRFAVKIVGGIARLSNEEPGIRASAGKAALSLSLPVARTAIRKIVEDLSHSFVLGETMEKSMLNARKFEMKGYIFSYDMLGESARTNDQAEKYFNKYLKSIKLAGKDTDRIELRTRPGISVKLSALYPRFELLKVKDVEKYLLPRLKELAIQAKKEEVMLTIDAEDAARTDITLLVFEKLLESKELAGFNGIGLAVQAYQKRSLAMIDYLAEFARHEKKQIPIRLVKGAYWDTEIKNAQIGGVDGYPVYTRKEHTDLSYLACAKKILAYGELFYPQFATHNALTISAVRKMAGAKKYELQKLYGMGDSIYDQVVGEVPCRVYAPVGEYGELLAYLLRRLLENSANTSFLYQLGSDVDPKELLANPLEKTKDAGGFQVSLPEDIYQPGRKNSVGADLGNASEINSLQKKIDKYKDFTWRAASLIKGDEITGAVKDAYNPGHVHDLVGKWHVCPLERVKDAIDAAESSFAEWSGTPVEQRAAILEKFADNLEKEKYEFITLCMKEAGKTLSDAIAEIRETIDYARYYATEARRLFSNPRLMPGATGELNQLSLHPRGVFACISPWNFPLAIFSGQLMAALAAGNTVVAKPAEQTPLIAYHAVKLLHKSGVPVNALNLVLGAGDIGTALVGDTRIAGVVFTGSSATAKKINITLAEKHAGIIPFIAETGGQNCMIIDSTALPEQVADDVIRSAFLSTGQRCSALRVAYIQEEIFDKLTNIIKDAAAMLKIGNPLDFTADIGPVIDDESRIKLSEDIRRMKKDGRIILSGLPTPLDGHFVAPHIFEIDSLKLLKEEVFGPVLHVIRFKETELDNIIGEINSSGYGLTFGIHTRIPARAEEMRQKIKAGNIYVNRSITGAVVGTQPFGGEGLSGTGFKAGGPHYMLKFLTERTYTVNVTAIGGNTELLSAKDRI